MLYRETSGGFEIWKGEPINGIRHPLIIETLWPREELEAAGLYSVTEEAAPAGKVVISSSVARVDGVVRMVYEYADSPPPDPRDYPLNDRQLRLGLVLSGISLDAIEGGINGISDVTQRAVARIWWDRSLRIEWDHPMRAQLQALVGLTDAQARAMWLMAKDLAA